MPEPPAGFGRSPRRRCESIFPDSAVHAPPPETSIAPQRAVGDMTVQARFVQREQLTLEEHGVNPERILPNLTVPRLIEYALRREEGVVTDHGAFAAVTTPK